MSKKYEVWGYDTFAGEDYLCGTYNTRSEAQRMMRKMERKVLSQDVSLRDTFEVLEVTEEVDEERARREAELERMISADTAHDPDFLNSVVGNLFQQLRSTKGEEKRFRVEYDCTETKDCFDKIAFTLITFKGMEQAIDVEIQFRKGEYYGAGTASKVFGRMPKSDFQYWLNSDYALKVMCVEVEELINSFYS